MARAMKGAVKIRTSWLQSYLRALVRLVVVAAVLAGYHCPVGARPVIFNFGDSNSDTGGFAKMAFKFYPPAGHTFCHQPTGRFCDGRLIIDFLCESLNTSFLIPYCNDPLGSNFNNGANFAIVGSKVLLAGSHALSTLNEQVQRFNYFKKTSLDLINKGPVDVQGFKNALYTIDIGQNDLNNLLPKMPYDQVLAQFPPIIAEIQSTVQDLYNNGGRNFWIHGTGALGCLPENLAKRNGSSNLDENGCLRTHNNAAKAFNAALSNMCDQKSLQLKDATIVYTDLFAIKYDLVANHASYGFEKPLMACCGYGGPPYNYDDNNHCMYPSAQVCEIGSKFISWDGTHLTGEANAI